MEESFLRRWSRMKRAPVDPATATPVVPAAAPTAPPAPLQAVDSLELSSDFLPFMKGEVAESLRREALQKLFTAEHFNVMDGLDVYIDDYNKFEPIGEEMLQQLMQAPGLLNDTVSEQAAEPEAAAKLAEDKMADALEDPENRAADKPA